MWLQPIRLYFITETVDRLSVAPARRSVVENRSSGFASQHGRIKVICCGGGADTAY